MKPSGLSAGLLLAALAIAAPAGGEDDPVAMPQTGDALADIAALLVLAETADSAQHRTPYIRVLDAMRVSATDDAADDPLSGWRSEADGLKADGLARDADRPLYRGRTLGPAYRRAQIAAGERMRIEQSFFAGERAELAAQSSGGQPVSLEIHNQRTEEEVCSAMLEPRAQCRWLPIFTERFTIDLVNQGQSAASVYIVFR